MVFHAAKSAGQHERNLMQYYWPAKRSIGATSPPGVAALVAAETAERTFLIRGKDDFTLAPAAAWLPEGAKRFKPSGSLRRSLGSVRFNLSI